MILSSLAILLGFAALVWSADRFVYGAAGIASHMGMSTLTIGLTIVALGTSAPEIFVSALASLDGAPGLAIGNAVGSNIANIGLVLGIALLMGSMSLPNSIKKMELPALIIVTLTVGALFFDGKLQIWDGLILLALFVGFFTILLKRTSSNPDDIDLEEVPDTSDAKLGTLALWFVIALIILIASSQLLVWGATNVAEALGVDDVIIGLTIVAIGTSLPELAAAIASALKKDHEMVLGNVVGSNVLNLLTVLPLPALISQPMIQAEVLSRDYLAMLVSTFMVCVFVYVSRKSLLSRWQGAVLLFGYVAYLSLLYWQSGAVPV